MACAASVIARIGDVTNHVGRQDERESSTGIPPQRCCFA
jgi:hypothetical protein